ncbi:MAG: DUF6036 family nucleotidyltransferase [Polyangiaceae bacterium]
MIDRFLADLDRTWRGERGPKIRLRVIGSTALMLQTSYVRGTKDSDVLQTTPIDDALKARLLEHAGPGTPLHKRHKIYLDIVGNGIPLLPGSPLWHPNAPLNEKLQTFEVEVLDVVDVVVSKLKRFAADDRSDIEAMIKMDRVPHDQLLERFRDAVDVAAYGAGARELRRYVDNLHRIERDSFVSEPTPIELPPWIDDA